MIVAVSTLAFGKMSKEKIAELAKERDWTVEFSSGFPYDKDMIRFFTETETVRLAHNYFPAPEIPFVMNLASTNPAVRDRSIAHCLQGLELTRIARASCFSAHAGFCIDPSPEQLGKPMDVNVPIDRGENWRLFTDAIDKVLLKASELGLSFLIENNVTAPFNLRSDGQEALLCSTPYELVRLVQEIGASNFGLLLDTAHLKISSAALGFNANEAVGAIEPYINYIHHSDNDGSNDSNDSIADDYWFLPWVRKFRDAVHVLEVRNLSPEEIESQIQLLQTYGRN